MAARPEITETVALARLSALRESPAAAEHSRRRIRSAGGRVLGHRLGCGDPAMIFRLLPGDTRCLTRSVVLMRMLARRQRDTN